MSSAPSNPEYKPPLDERFYSLDSEELAFFKAQTGLIDDNDLKAHIIAVQAKAYEIYCYPCIRGFMFTKLRMSRLPLYDHVIRLGREREGAILLDIGCCFGNDVRKAVADGYPVQNVVVSDLRQGFWDLGHELFKSSPESFPVRFIGGDVFDPAHLAPHPPFYQPLRSPPPPLRSLKSLTPLHGHISAINASSLFHLFNEDEQLELARALASLLSPRPGSVILGAQGGMLQKGELLVNETCMFCHSPDSWLALWDGLIFEKGTVKVQAELKEINRPGYPLHQILVWGVTRL